MLGISPQGQAMADLESAVTLGGDALTRARKGAAAAGLDPDVAEREARSRVAAGQRQAGMTAARGAAAAATTPPQGRSGKPTAATARESG